MSIKRQVNRMINEELLISAKHLSEPYRKTFWLYYVERMTQKEIGKRMNISLYKVKMHLSKGMYLLRKGNRDGEYEKAKKILYASPQTTLKPPPV